MTTKSGRRSRPIHTYACRLVTESHPGTARLKTEALLGARENIVAVGVFLEEYRLKARSLLRGHDMVHHYRARQLQKDEDSQDECGETRVPRAIPGRGPAFPRSRVFINLSVRCALQHE